VKKLNILLSTLAVGFFVACGDDNDSVSASTEKSSSSVENDDLSSSSVDESESSSSVDEDLCNGKEYDSETYYCLNGKTRYYYCDVVPEKKDDVPCYGREDKKAYTFCGGEMYESDKYACNEKGEVSPKCSITESKSILYDTTKSFCVEGVDVYELCDGKSYDVEAEKCEEGQVVPNDGKHYCNGKEYDSETYYCLNGKTRYYYCDVVPEKKDDVPCYGREDKKAYTFCGGEMYESDKYACNEKGEVSLKCRITESYSILYDSMKSFCVEGVDVYELCDGKSYDVEKEVCEAGKVVDKPIE